MLLKYLGAKCVSNLDKAKLLKDRFGVVSIPFFQMKLKISHREAKKFYLHLKWKKND